VNLVDMDFLGVPRPKRGGSGYPLYPASPNTIGVSGCRFYPSRGASRSKQGTKIEEMRVWGKEIQNTSNRALIIDQFRFVRIESRRFFLRPLTSDWFQKMQLRSTFH